MRGHITALTFALLTQGAALRAEEEVNVWPLYVSPTTAQATPGVENWSSIGPLFFSQPLAPGRFAEATRLEGLRPLFVTATDDNRTVKETDVLYPLFTYRTQVDGYRWSVFSLINHYATQSPTETHGHRGFDLWPFYFSRDTGTPETSYHAVLPIYGKVPHRFGQDRLTWVLFPLYAKWEKNDVTTTTAPWPFVKVLSGQGNHGFELWPLFGYRHKADTYREQFYLWPLIYKQERKLWETQPDVRQGFLPFFASAKNAERESKNFLLFWGYVDRVAPIKYHETDYLWPIWVQGHGDDRQINRWGPFYTHSVVKGVDKTWIGWPVWRQVQYVDGGLQHRRRQILYFLYHDTAQRSATNPSLPVAHRTHVWPLVSIWDNGAGKKQIQAFSPLEVFFPNNDVIRLTYSPLFAVYRFNQPAPGQTQHSVLWNLISYRKNNDAGELHVGPLFSKERHGQQRRYTIGNGLLAWERSAETGKWKIGFFDFKRRTSSRPAPAKAP